MDSVVCGLCSKILSSPRVLNCCHEFDSKCLEELCSQSEFSAALSCPTCGSETELPSGGIAALPIDYSALRYALLTASNSGNRTFPFYKYNYDYVETDTILIYKKYLSCPARTVHYPNQHLLSAWNVVSGSAHKNLQFILRFLLFPVIVFYLLNNSATLPFPQPSAYSIAHQ